jgi:hypothetical protein
MSTAARKPVVYVIYYSMFGHVETLAKTVVKGFNTMLNSSSFQF